MTEPASAFSEYLHYISADLDTDFLGEAITPMTAIMLTATIMLMA